MIPGTLHLALLPLSPPAHGRLVLGYAATLKADREPPPPPQCAP
eukprot:CAMPEP_0118934418 /NCGR_PEP_ID=MMETSP1169-20130426/13816_1 /TAXON_ID=36882 /ORGANISM="Pyramimonas obovata, Strain CCMP722" /LENGTH=43 /DNA_ID= /DNA_START= /DNA_END= /DNA_ORIENTATION=